MLTDFKIFFTASSVYSTVHTGILKNHQNVIYILVGNYVLVEGSVNYRKVNFCITITKYVLQRWKSAIIQ